MPVGRRKLRCHLAGLADERRNLIGNFGGAMGFTSGANHDILGLSMLLSMLACCRWVGTVVSLKPHLPRPGSPAIDAGDPGYYHNHA